MSAKNFLAIVGVFISAFVLLISALFYWIDPLFLYRQTELYEPQYIANERYQMPGLVKTMDYQTLITGTSMGRNFEENYVNEKFGTKSFNGSLPASTAREQSMVVQLALQNKEKVDRVFWELNFYSFSGEPDWVTDFPEYMYDDSKLNDIRYLFNSYSLEVLVKNLQANVNDIKSKRDVETLYKFGNDAPMDDFERIVGAIDNVDKEDAVPEFDTAEKMLRSFEKNVISVVEDHPDTTFTFFFAPYPIYNQFKYYKSNPEYLEERAKFKAESFKLLSKYPNIQLYDFQLIKYITFNIGNFMGDGVHYYRHINRWMVDYMEENIPIRNVPRYEYLLQQYVALVEEFSLDQLIEHPFLKEKYGLLNSQN
ncbi:hypothetical protein [Bacillus sp. SM2101]|uniref:hypothetical protein n=1 Tax=Bacillus sp. SM2101 TaxID=2805366 RepID=UPI001BDE30B8|nr:hypothetical protein [Bacillus sp. SM2101]